MGTVFPIRRDGRPAPSKGPGSAGWRSVESADKPGSVGDDHSSGTPVTERLMRPTRRHLRAAGCQRRASLFGLAPEGVCRAVSVAADAVRSYRTLSPLPAGRMSDDIGGLLSVALSVGSRRPGVTWPLALRSPDFPPPPRTAAAIAWPTPQVTLGQATWMRKHRSQHGDGFKPR